MVYSLVRGLTIESQRLGEPHVVRYFDRDDPAGRDYYESLRAELERGLETTR